MIVYCNCLELCGPYIAGMDSLYLTFSVIDFTAKMCWTSSGLLMVHFSSLGQLIILASYGMRTKVRKTLPKQHNYNKYLLNCQKIQLRFFLFLFLRFCPSDSGCPFPLCSRCGMGPVGQLCCFPKF